MIDEDDLDLAKDAYFKALDGEETYYVNLDNDQESKPWNKGFTAGLAAASSIVYTMLNHSEGYSDIYSLNKAIQEELNSCLSGMANQHSYDAGKAAGIQSQLGILEQTMSEFFNPDDEVVKNGDEDEV